MRKICKIKFSKIKLNKNKQKLIAYHTGKLQTGGN